MADPTLEGETAAYLGMPERVRYVEQAIYRYSGAAPQPSALHAHLCQPGLIVHYVKYWESVDPDETVIGGVTHKSLTPIKDSTPEGVLAREFRRGKTLANPALSVSFVSDAKENR